MMGFWVRMVRFRVMVNGNDVVRVHGVVGHVVHHSVAVGSEVGGRCEAETKKYDFRHTGRMYGTSGQICHIGLGGIVFLEVATGVNYWLGLHVSCSYAHCPTAQGN